MSLKCSGTTTVHCWLSWEEVSEEAPRGARAGPVPQVTRAVLHIHEHRLLVLLLGHGQTLLGVAVAGLHLSPQPWDSCSSPRPSQL